MTESTNREAAEPHCVYLEPLPPTWTTLLTPEPCGGHVPAIYWHPMQRETGPYLPAHHFPRAPSIMHTAALVLVHQGTVSVLGRARALSVLKDLIPTVTRRDLQEAKRRSGVSPNDHLNDLDACTLATLGRELCAWSPIVVHDAPVLAKVG